MTQETGEKRPDSEKPSEKTSLERNLKRIFGKFAFEKGPAYPGDKKPGKEKEEEK